MGELTEGSVRGRGVAGFGARRLVSLAMAVATAALEVGMLLSAVGASGAAGDVKLFVALVIGTAGMGVVGAVLAAKAPENPLGPLFQIAAMFMTLSVFASVYGERGLTNAPGLPFIPVAGWLSQWAFGPAFAATFTAFILFPDGRPPTARWRPVVWLIWGGTALAAIGTTFGPSFFEFDPGYTVANPFQMGPKGLLVGLNAVGSAAMFAGGILAVVSVFVRFHRSHGEERQQLRWLAWAAALILTSVIALFVTGVAASGGAAFDLAFLALVASVLLGLPIATAIAVLRYRLYDLDLVVKKTAIYSIVAIALTGLYLVLLAGAALVGLGPIPAGVVFLLTFTFARNRARKVAERIVYGTRATPFEVLSEFSERVGETYSVDDVLPRMTQLLAAGTGAREARAWIRQGRTLKSAAAAPRDVSERPDVDLIGEDLPPFGDGVGVFPVMHQGELLGAITLGMAANDPMDAAKERLAQGVASQAGLALRNVRLVQDLRASRRRIVTAQDERAKALERNIHDGAQQQLVALTIRLRLAEQMAEREPGSVGPILGDLRDQASAALEDLRDLARGVYPPLLADQGLFAALQAQARKAAIAVEVAAGDLGRHPPDIESTVYFCVLEALNNVGKYAGASGAVVSVEETDDVLAFEVRDDGDRFDTEGSTYGTGLQGMADRLDAVGGRLSVRSAPGKGTVVRGAIPIPAG